MRWFDLAQLGQGLPKGKELAPDFEAANCDLKLLSSRGDSLNMGAAILTVAGRYTTAPRCAHLSSVWLSINQLGKLFSPTVLIG
jgi:hypothetical protein